MTANAHRNPPGSEPRAAGEEGFHDLVQKWETASRNSKNRADLKFRIIAAYFRLEKEGLCQKEILARIKADYGPFQGTGRKALWEMRAKVKGHPRECWPPLLLDEYKGNPKKADFSQEAKDWIYDHWAEQSQPLLKPVWRKARKMAKDRGWTVPSYKVVLDWKNNLPDDAKRYGREGPKASHRNLPTPNRIYTNLPLHEEWVADGHEMDLFVTEGDGSKPYRPTLVAFMESRTRRFLGWGLGRSESAALVRITFRRACENAGYIIPRTIYTDNGMAFTALQFTGGAENRFRNPKKKDEPLGAFLKLGIELRYAIPGEGQAKHIERAWQEFTNLAKMIGAQAYCGHSPSSRPANFDPNQAIPLALLEEHVAEAVIERNAREHSGEGMDGGSPNDVYARLMGSTKVRKITPEMLDEALLIPMHVKVRSGAIKTKLGKYWRQELGKLNRNITYEARYDPDNASQPVRLYGPDGRFLYEVPPFGDLPYRDQHQWKAVQNAKREAVRTSKEKDAALRGLRDARLGKARKPKSPDPTVPASAPAKIIDIHSRKERKPAAAASPAFDYLSCLETDVEQKPAQSHAESMKDTWRKIRQESGTNNK